MGCDLPCVRHDAGRAAEVAGNGICVDCRCVIWTMGPGRYHHNWFAKLFLRQEKKAQKSRGIRLLDVPPNFATVAEQNKIQEAG